MTLEKLPYRPKTIIPEGVEEFQDLVHEFVPEQEQVDCFRCDSKLPLKYSSYTWEFSGRTKNLVFESSYCAGPIPVYECEPCGERFVPAVIFNAMAEMIRKDIIENHSYTQFQYPDHWHPKY